MFAFQMYRKKTYCSNSNFHTLFNESIQNKHKKETGRFKGHFLTKEKQLIAERILC